MGGGLGNYGDSYTDRWRYRFLLASLKVETIMRETTIHQRRNMLNAMRDGSGLGDAYAATMERIRGGNQNLV